MENNLQFLPYDQDFETVAILKQLSITSRALAELKGVAKTMPNQNILINAIMINEAKMSSGIENIVTTHDEIYKAMVKSNDASPEAKEVTDYRSAIWEGYKLIKFIVILFQNMHVEGIHTSPLFNTHLPLSPCFSTRTWVARFIFVILPKGRREYANSPCLCQARYPVFSPRENRCRRFALSHILPRWQSPLPSFRPSIWNITFPYRPNRIFLPLVRKRVFPLPSDSKTDAQERVLRRYLVKIQSFQRKSTAWAGYNIPCPRSRIFEPPLARWKRTPFS